MYSWGSKPYSQLSQIISERCALPHIRLEDGFICSFGHSKRSTKYSLVVDPDGIYYDSTRPSRLENILNGLDSHSHLLADREQLERAGRLIEQIVDQNVNKYNYLSTSSSIELPPGTVLVVDQTRGDQSVRFGGMNEAGFRQMLTDALEHHPAEKVVVKVHPDVLAGKKQGYLTEFARARKIKLIDGDIAADQLLNCHSVYTGTSLMGMEALLRGVRVKCFGLPFYAGWGLTDDRIALPRRAVQRSLAELFIASYVLYPDYVDPITAQRCSIEDILEHIEVQLEQRQRVRKTYTCVGITPWKRRYLDRYLQRTDFVHRHLSASALRNQVPPDVTTEDHYLVWGRKGADSEIEQHLKHQQVARMEDGFIRSVGLGSNFTAPRSLVIDDVGIYFDATQPSRLETLLQNYQCKDVELQRASGLMAMLQKHRISKYDIAANDDGEEVDFYRTNPVILVIGQVDGDASLRFGTQDITSNLQLIEAVRSRNPEAVLVYKPHPDVVSGNRSDGIDNKSKLTTLCDRVETELPIHTVMHLCEEIHTMTSLAGMEALLMGKRVVTYGMPFYAGWGLTSDMGRIERRNKKLTIQELVYISYILYPSYLDIESGEFTSAEKTVMSLVNQRNHTAGSLTAAGLEKYVNIVRNIKKGLTYAA